MAHKIGIRNEKCMQRRTVRCRMPAAQYAQSALISRQFLVLPVRIELTTSPLPRGCSTTELRQQPDEMNALKNRGDHCHMGGIRASAPGLRMVAAPPPACF